MNENQHSGNVLEFEHVEIVATGEDIPCLSGVSFSVNAGDLMVVHLAQGYSGASLADAVQGLLRPKCGRVLFQDQDWVEMTPDEQAIFRGQIGRVFNRGGWISNLDVDENVTLSLRHHTTRPRNEIQSEAMSLAVKAGFGELPMVRPDLLNANERKRAQWIRAFLGDPTLVILEEPMHDVYEEYAEHLIKLVEEARQHGCGVLWLTRHFGLHSTLRQTTITNVYTMKKNQLIFEKQELS